jgi:hypothetical protein
MIHLPENQVCEYDFNQFESYLNYENAYLILIMLCFRCFTHRIIDKIKITTIRFTGWYIIIELKRVISLFENVVINLYLDVNKIAFNFKTNLRMRHTNWSLFKHLVFFQVSINCIRFYK